ncbi:dynein regulatory complex protein 12 isoform X2 [Carettochelys insculpta]|uniref:dynein regulatory complex protein 12 isoform X2 n=1 Tax=Carettochelys insculpta TaxID=44489 RepID=UPI003EB8CD6F
MAPGSRRKGKKGGKQEKKKNAAVLRRDVAKADGEGLKQRLLELEQELERDDKQDIYEATCQHDIQQAQEEREQVLGEKDETISTLQGKIDALQTAYEEILHGSLDRVLSKLAAIQRCWEEEATALHLEHKEKLREFGLNPLEF